MKVDIMKKNSLNKNGSLKAHYNYPWCLTLKNKNVCALPEIGLKDCE